jgi:hypothetical protein
MNEQHSRISKTVLIVIVTSTLSDFSLSVCKLVHNYAFNHVNILYINLSNGTLMIVNYFSISASREEGVTVQHERQRWQGASASRPAQEQRQHP